MLSTDQILGTTVGAWTLLVLKGEDELPLIDETNLNRMDSHDDDLDNTGSSLFGDNYVRSSLGQDSIEQDSIDLDSRDMDSFGLDEVIDLRDEQSTEGPTFESAAIVEHDLAQEALVPAGLSLFDRDPGEAAQPESITLDLEKAFAPAEAEAEFEQETGFEQDPDDESGTGSDSPLFGSHKPLSLGNADQSIFDRDLTRSESTIAFVPAGDVVEPAWRFPALVLVSLVVIGFAGFQLFNLLSSPDGGDVDTVKTPPTTFSVSTTVAEVPTTLAPTTVAPTTGASVTTAAPETTVAPTTAAVAAPTTRRPVTTRRPATTAAPTTEAPVTTAPTTAAPTTAPPPTFGTPAPPPTAADQTTEAAE